MGGEHAAVKQCRGGPDAGATQKTETLLEQYCRLPDADPLKLTCFEMSGLLTVKRQAEQLEENGKRFTQLLKAICEAKKQRRSVLLVQLMKRMSG